jgi:hypothetical protein
LSCHLSNRCPDIWCAWWRLAGLLSLWIGWRCFGMTCTLHV